MFHIIAKPLRGKKAKLFGQIEEKLKEKSIAYQMHFTTKRGDARALAEEFSREGGNVVIVVGGDGTLNEVMHGLHVENAALGLIPAGTGNDFAVAAKIPSGLAALELILNSEPKQTDYIDFSDGRKSLNIAGLGIDVDILERCERMKLFHARSKYFLSLLKSLFTYRGFQAKIEANGKTWERTLLLAAVCNGRQFGGGIKICPPARIDDGKLRLVTVDCPKRLKIPFALIKLVRGKVLSLPFAHYEECEEAKLTVEGEFVAQYDGELFPSKSFCARVRRDLKMYRG